MQACEVRGTAVDEMVETSARFIVCPASQPDGPTSDLAQQRAVLAVLATLCSSMRAFARGREKPNSK